MPTVFVDTFYFFALGNGNDPAHGKAKAFSQTYRGRKRWISLVPAPFRDRPAFNWRFF